VLLALLLVTACGAQAGEGGERACTAIGTRVGIGLDIAPGVTASAVTLVACWNGACRTYPVELRPSTVATGSTCAGAQPADSCSAQVRETGGQHGFVDIPDLPAAPVTVTLSDDVHGTLEITPKLLFPNGPGCGGGGPQANLIVDATGLRAR
jgi:hypothetical protein